MSITNNLLSMIPRRKSSVPSKPPVKPVVQQYGCEHYVRKCAFVSPCCGRIYLCRMCHDDNEDHRMDRHEVTRIQCLICFTFQPVQRFCSFCEVEFGQYFCSVCRMFDDVDKKQFHCIKCGLCRVGGENNFFHCDKCDMCLSKDLKGSHKCVEAATRRDCPVCLDDLHTATTSLRVMSCGHITHEKCWFGMLQKGIYECPLCGHSMLNLESVWRRLDAERARNPMNEEIRVNIHCKDCSQTSETLYHRVGLKCTLCGSYNTEKTDQSPTRRTSDDRSSANHNSAPQISTNHNSAPQISTNHNSAQQISTNHNSAQQIATNHNSTPQISINHNSAPPISTNHNSAQQISTNHNSAHQISTNHNSAEVSSANRRRSDTILKNAYLGRPNCDLMRPSTRVQRSSYDNMTNMISPPQSSRNHNSALLSFTHLNSTTQNSINHTSNNQNSTNRNSANEMSMTLNSESQSSANKSSAADQLSISVM